MTCKTVCKNAFKAFGKKAGLGVVAVFLMVADAAGQTNTCLVEAEEFQFKGKWFAEPDENCLGGTLLRATGANADSLADAFTAVDIKEAGTYTIWMRTPDYADRPSSRQLQLSVDGIPCEHAGRHGKIGFYWEKVGSRTLAKKEVLLRLHNFNYGRCDAVLLTKDASADPNELPLAAISKWRKTPAALPVVTGAGSGTSSYLPITEHKSLLAGIENNHIRVQFYRLQGDKNAAIVCRTEIKINDQWRHYQGNLEDHKVMLLYADSAAISFAKYFPAWSAGVKADDYFEFEGRKYPVASAAEEQNPFRAGSLSEAIPVSVQQADKQTVAVQYITRNHSEITGFWRIENNGYHVSLQLICKTAQPGYYSLAVAAFNPLAQEKIINVLLPPMYEYKRLPATPQMLVSAITQQPLAITETVSNGIKWADFISGDIKMFKDDWGTSDYSPIGFSVKNEKNEVQPVAFAPVMGMPDSEYTEGQLIDRTFILGMLPAGWEAALSYISDSVFNVRDYRTQPQTSLTGAVFNMVDLIKDENYGGWDSKLKGFYDIEGNPETAPTVVNATPLATIATAILSRDEALYLSRALPTIEYTLSRSGYRWAIDIVPTGYNKTRRSLELNPFQSQFTTSYYAGLNSLLGQLNPWLRSIALPGDSLRKVAGYSTPFIPWVQALAAYKMTGDAGWLQQAKEQADTYIAHQVYTNSNKPLAPTPFYNASFYAPWWHLLDLYEITKDRKYLDAAAYGSYFTIAGIRSFPQVQDSAIIIHPGGQYEGNTHIWWKGKQPYRLGFPRKAGDAPEKKVPAWLVSPVGLGFEQPSTYFLTAKNKNVRPVFMSSWAPHLLRLFQYTDNKLFEIYARNAVIGRFTNYPGYYATGYTDIPLQPDFPYKGPDVSSIYYHHIPPHLAFSLDYLISEAIQRSKGNVQFPYSNQEGFVWFANRVYGVGAGSIFDDEKATLWLRKDLVKIEAPSVNYVTAISKDKFWVLLSSESAQDEMVTIKLSAATGIVETGNGVVYTAAAGKSGLLFSGSEIKVAVPAKGFRAVAIPLKSPYIMPQYKPLANGMRVIDMGQPWGKLFVFRIRSPFGWDSIYGFAETGPLKDATMQVTCNGATKNVPAYPFEWSFYKIKMEEKAEMVISLKAGSGKQATKKIIMNGN
ncbi:MAG: hypothetical protein QM640_06450 [Niabella sp.]